MQRASRLLFIRIGGKEPQDTNFPWAVTSLTFFPFTFSTFVSIVLHKISWLKNKLFSLQTIYLNYLDGFMKSFTSCLIHFLRGLFNQAEKLLQYYWCKDINRLLEVT